MFEDLAFVLNLDLKLVLLGIAVGIGFTNAMKKFAKIKGYTNLIFVGLCALVFGFLFGMPDPMSVLGYVAIIFVGEVIAWETVKASMHKMGK